MTKQVSIDWAEDTIKRTLPWDEDQYVVVRRFTAKEKRQRQALASRYRFGSEPDSEVEIMLTYDRLKEFEWNTCIVDFRLKDAQGRVYTYGTKEQNQRIFDHVSEALENFLDALILEVNKESSTEVPNEDVKAVEGNSNDSLNGNSDVLVQ